MWLLRIRTWTLATAMTAGVRFHANAQFVVERSPFLEATEARVDPYEQTWHIVDTSNLAPVIAQVKVEGLHPRKPILLPAAAHSQVTVQPYRRYTRICIRSGYMMYVDRWWAAAPEKEGESDGAAPHDTLWLRPLEVGLELALPSLEFLGDGQEIYYTSLPTLASLVEFMAVNPMVRLALIGHVNAPGPEPDEETCQRMGRERARAVWEYLVTQGVDPRRLEVQGVGRAGMLFPDPQTPEEVDANRRVSIRIVDL